MAAGRDSRSPSADGVKVSAGSNQVPSLRRSLRLCTVAVVFGGFWWFIVGGAALTQYAKALGLSDAGFGILAAMPFIGTLMQIPASYFVERFGHRKRVFMTAGLAHRAMWLVIAAVPWMPLAQDVQVIVFLGVLTVSSLLAHVAMPAQVSFLADLMPSRIRGRYSAQRMRAWGVTGTIVPIAVGILLDQTEVIMRTISILMVIGAISGMINFVVYGPVPDRRKTPLNPSLTLWRLLRQPLADRDFRRFLAYTATLTFAVGFLGQYMWLYLLDVIFADAERKNLIANIMLIAVPGVFAIVFYPMWGRLTDRLGRKPVMIICGLLIGVGGMGWLFMTTGRWWLGYLSVMIAAFAWPGVELGRLNVLLWLSESKAERQHHLGTAYVAVNSIVVAVAGICSGLFGGAVAWAFETWHAVWLGVPVTYHSLLILCSVGTRFLALGWLIRMEEPASFSTRDAMRYMAANLYSNLQQAVFMPSRMAARLGRLTYKLGPNRRSDQGPDRHP